MIDDLLTNYYQVLLYDSEEHYEYYIKELTDYISNNKNNPIAYNNRGLAYSEIGMFEEAKLDFEESIRIKINAIPYKILGGMLERNNFYEKALEAYSKAIDINKKDATIYRCRAHLFIKFKKPQNAIEDLTEAINIDPKFANTYLERSNLYKEIRNDKLALKDLKKYNKLNK